MSINFNINRQVFIADEIVYPVSTTLASVSEDLLAKVEKSSLGLRHVTGIELANREVSHGFYNGCSLNLNPQKSPLFKDLTKGLEIKHYCSDFDEMVQSFIKRSLIFDLNNSSKLNLVNPGTTIINELALVVEEAQFCLVDYSNTYSMPTDFVMWGDGLGRYPKTNIKASQIHYFSPMKIEDLNFNATELDTIIDSGVHTDIILNKISSRIYSHLLTNLNQFFSNC